MNNPILEYLDERRKARLKKPGDKSTADVEAEFQLVNWVGNAAHRAGQLSIVSHPGKYSHPDVKISPFIARSRSELDGYVRSGNVPTDHDVLGNAAALDVYAFLSLKLSDGKSLLHHFQSNSKMLVDLLGVDPAVFAGWRKGFLKIQQTDLQPKTDGNVKQVYFPVESSTEPCGYHLLSVLTCSGLVTVNRNRIREMRFSDDAKSAREARKAGSYSEHPLDDVWNVLSVKYGGTQPQNISRLNSANAGEAWLLPCLPPTFSMKHVRLPREDFFDSLRPDERLKMIYRSLHRIFASDYRAVTIREARKRWFEAIFDWVFERVWILQQQPSGWSDGPNVQLPRYQQLWLDSAHFDDRNTDDDWRDEVCTAFASWTAVTYRRLQKYRGEIIELGQPEETRFREELNAYASSLSGDLM